jgi:predicted Zn-dependent protease
MMRRLLEIHGFVRAAADLLARDKDLAGWEIYAASGEHRIARLAYTSDIPCRGVEELKSLHADGFQVRIAMRRDEHETGGAAVAGEFNLEALRAALERARRATVVDPHFPGFPSDPHRLAARAAHGGDLSRASDAALATCAWQVLGGALDAFGRDAAATRENPGLVLGGDVSIIHDRIAIASSGLPEIRADESAHFSSSVTALVESLDAKGTSGALGDTIAKMRAASAALGRVAVRRALAARGGVRPGSGNFRVVLGPQPVAEILNYMVMGSLTTGAFHAASSAYQTRFGARVMDERLSLTDDPFSRAGAVRRRITGEGLPAARVELIREGRLVGLLSNYYDAHRLETDEHRAEKLGPAGERAVFAAASGYRLGEGGGRRFDAHPGASGTNVILRARGGAAPDAMLRGVRDGVYIGRIWYTYPINGQRAGDFTCTVTGDSWMIRKGALAEPLAPNCVRINANIAQIFDNPIALGARPLAATVWGSPEAYYVAPIAAADIALAEVAPAS